MSHKILIADDEPNILISLEYLMKREGYEVHLARDGQEAMDSLRAERECLPVGEQLALDRQQLEAAEAIAVAHAFPLHPAAARRRAAAAVRR